jgi:hypothetical protein
MPVIPLPGHVRFRAYQMGPEVSMNTPVAATRRYPGRFTPNINPNWTDPDIDTGTLGRAVPPYRLAPDYKGQYVGPLAFDDIPTFMTGIYKPVTPSSSGTAYTWLCLPAETSADSFQTHTAEWGDEVTGDQFQYYSGVLEKLAINFPETLAPAQVTADYVFGQVNWPKTMTAGLSVDSNPSWVYGADTYLAIDSTAGGIGGTILSKTLHGATVTISQSLDVKRFMDGASVRFQAQNYGRGLRETEFSGIMAKSTSSLTEVANWLNNNAQKRFLSLKTVSPTLIPSSAIAYSQEMRFAGYWYTRTDSISGNNNTGVSLVCRTVYDATLTYNTWWQAVCARATL